MKPGAAGLRSVQERLFHRLCGKSCFQLCDSRSSVSPVSPPDARNRVHRTESSQRARRLRLAAARRAARVPARKMETRRAGCTLTRRRMARCSPRPPGPTAWSTTRPRTRSAGVTCAFSALRGAVSVRVKVLFSPACASSSAPRARRSSCPRGLRRWPPCAHTEGPRRCLRRRSPRKARARGREQGDMAGCCEDQGRRRSGCSPRR